MSADLHILQLVRELPLPPRTGTHVRALGIGSILRGFGTVDVVGRPSRFGTSECDEAAQYGSVTAVPAPRPPAGVVAALRHGPRSPRHVRARAQALDRAGDGRRYDLAVVEELYATHPGVVAALRAGGTRVIHSSHNVESELPIPYPAFVGRLSGRLVAMDRRAVAAFERRMLAQCDGAVCVSDADRAGLLAAVGPAWSADRMVVIPNCAPPRTQPLPRWEDRRGVLLAGSFRWTPNQEGLRWFIERVAPILRRTAPSLPITVVGNAISGPDERDLQELGIAVHVNVDDVGRFHREARVAVVPLFTGGGSRVRIVEALSAGLRVVTTTKGAEGQPADISRGLDITDSPQEFAERTLQAAGASSAPSGQAPPEWIDFRDTMAGLLRTIGLTVTARSASG